MTVEPFVPPPVPVDCVYATVVLAGDGRSAQFYWGRNAHTGQPLILIDWEVHPLDASIWFLADSTLRDFARERRARIGSMGTFVEGANIAQIGELQGYLVRAIPEHITTPSAWPSICRSTALYLSDSKVGITEASLIKMASRPFLTDAGLSSVEKRPDDPIVPAFVYGVVMGLDEASARPPRSAKVKVLS